MLPSVVEHLYDELDGVSDLVSPVQPLLTQAVTDDDHLFLCKGMMYKDTCLVWHPMLKSR